VGLWLDCNFRIPPQEEEEFTSNRLNKLFRGRRAGKYGYLVMGLIFEHWWLTKIIIFLMNIKNSTIIPIKTPFLRKKLDEKFSSVTPSARKYKRNGRGVPLYGKLSVLEIFSGTLERCKRVFLDNSRHNDVARKASEIPGQGTVQSSSSETEVHSSLMTNTLRGSDLCENCATVITQEGKTKALLHKLPHFQAIPTKSLTPSIQDSEAENVNVRLDEVQRLKKRADAKAICKILSTDRSEVVRARAIEALAEIKCSDNAVDDFDQSKVAYSDTGNDFMKSIKEIQELLSKLENGEIKNVQSLIRTAIMTNPEIKYEWQTLLKDEDTVEILRCIIPHSSTLIDTIRSEIL
jgi:hypothetical protein